MSNEEKPSVPLIPFADVEALQSTLDGFFIVSATTMDLPQNGYVRFRGRFVGDDTETYYDEINGRFNALDYTPEMHIDEYGAAIITAMPYVHKAKPTPYFINLLLFIATIFSTLYIGALYAETNPDYTFSPAWLLSGWPYSLSILTILGAHELGHYFAARYHKVPVSLPFFIPFPISIIGTMGAFIQLKARIKNRRALLDIGASGPLAGMVFALPILWHGIATSSVLPLPTIEYPAEGNSLLYLAMKYLIHGQILPSNGVDISLNQVAWAGWVGLLVTGLNLLPLGQLDGGHIAFVLLGKKAQKLFWPVILALAAIIIFTETHTWILWILMLFFIGRRHAEPLDMITPLDRKRRWIAIGTLCLFFLVFVPIPLQQIIP